LGANSPPVEVIDPVIVIYKPSESKEWKANYCNCMVGNVYRCLVT